MHIVQRGNNRQPCFFDDRDRAFYLFHLERLLAPAACELHAYCLMANHVHLLLTPARADSCAMLMKHLAGLYTQYINRRLDRSGTLWEGRFHSSIVQSEAYLLACYRYVELNPVRAGLVPHPAAYRWSSYRANAGLSSNGFLTAHPEYARLATAAVPAHRAYAALVESGIQAADLDAIRKAASGNIVLGDDLFKAALASATGRRVDRSKPGRRSNEGPSLI